MNTNLLDTDSGRILKMQTIKDIRHAYGFTQKSFADYFGIPKRTVENWEGGVNRCPEYLVNLILYKLTHEFGKKAVE